LTILPLGVVYSRSLHFNLDFEDGTWAQRKRVRLSTKK
jgi:hypothetical protein